MESLKKFLKTFDLEEGKYVVCYRELIVKPNNSCILTRDINKGYKKIKNESFELLESDFGSEYKNTIKKIQRRQNEMTTSFSIEVTKDNVLSTEDFFLGLDL